MRECDLACALEPGVVSALISAILLKSIAECRLVVRFDVVKCPQEELSVGAQCLNCPSLDINGNHVLKWLDSTFVRTSPELPFIRVPHSHQKRFCLLHSL